MSHSVFQLLGQQPTNPVQETRLTTATDKEWTKQYPSEIRLDVHTTVDPRDGTSTALFDGPLLEQYRDDRLRLLELANPPTYRTWKLASEEDVVNWFHTEVSNIVLGAFARYPPVLQSAHERPLGNIHISETVDVAYSVTRERIKTHIIIGEFKRALIKEEQWQDGTIEAKGQVRLAQELRGYAHKYSCPQVFCFDGSTLLLLQFRAATREDIRSPNCKADCWVIPRDNLDGTTLRYAFYRFMVQGFRRCQGSWAYDMKLRNRRPDKRLFYDGRPLWKVNGRLQANPWGHRRDLIADYGAFYWTKPDSEEPLLTAEGSYEYDTRAFWRTEQPLEAQQPAEVQQQAAYHVVTAAPTTMDVDRDDDDIYSAN